uniref:Putative ovule protein n=1 Tax=Solanum chacoense TaxID=4108 RepID=A0A0V0I0U1_SOLCH
MDVCDFVGGVKVEDNAVIVKLWSLKCVAKVFRVVEFCFVVLLLLWISTRLPFAVRISGEYFRQIVGLLLSPVFIFILCNFIVLILLLKSGFHSRDSSIFRNVAGAEVLYDSFLKNTEFSADFSSGNSSLVPGIEARDIVYEDKQTIFEESIVTNQVSCGSEELETVMNKALTKPKAPRRTQSEKLNKETVEEISVKFRRSETEKCRKVTNPGDSVSPETAHEVDELSNEEFQKAIENFIAKQTKFHRQEKLAIVLHSQA